MDKCGCKSEPDADKGKEAAASAMKFSNQVVAKLGTDKVASILLFGPALRGDGDELYTWTILREAGKDSLDLVKSIYRSLPGFPGGFIPLVSTASEVEDIGDSFPLSFMEALSTYKVLHGSDIFEGLELDMEQLRPQVEQHLRSRVIQMRTKWLDYDPKDTRGSVCLLDGAYSDCLMSARISLLLKMKIYLLNRKDIQKEIAGRFPDVSCKTFCRFVDIFEVSGKVDQKAVPELYFGALEFVSSLLHEVDMMGRK